MNIGASRGLPQTCLWSAALTGALTLGSVAHARPGTHGAPVSTWDTRASSIVLSSRLGFMGDAQFAAYSYHANFTSTTGRLSAQFGLHYLNLAQRELHDSRRGGSASTVAVMNMPVTDRWDNGLPVAAIAFYMGAAPAVLTRGPANDITVPLVIGLGVPISPDDIVTITPWGEPSVSINVDSHIRSFDLVSASNEEFRDLRRSMGGTDELSESAVGDIVDEAVEVDFDVAIALRAGLDFAFHFGPRWSLNLGVALSSLGSAFEGPLVVTGVGALVYRWDDVVPSVLPPTRPPGCACGEDAEEASPAEGPETAAPTPPPAAAAPAPRPMGRPKPMDHAAPAAQPPAPPKRANRDR